MVLAIFILGNDAGDRCLRDLHIGHGNRAGLVCRLLLDGDVLGLRHQHNAGMLPIPDSTLLLSVLHQRGSSRVEVQLHAAAPAFELVYLSAAVEIVHIGIQVVDVCLIADIFRHIGDQPVHHFTAVVHEFLDQTGIGAVVRTALELCNELRIADLLHTVRQAELRVDRGNVMQAIVEDAVLCLRLDDRNGCAFFCCRKAHMAPALPPPMTTISVSMVSTISLSGISERHPASWDFLQ